MKKITVIIITYNQEQVIAQTLDSILCQKEWGLYRILIGDDCSKDKTWELLLQYKAKFPDIVVPYQNEHNIGIYANIENIITKRDVDSDLYIMTAGDDPLCDGFFESVQNVINNKDIDTDEKVGIYSDWKTVDPNGKERVYRQNRCLSGHPLWSLYIRGLITSRSLCFSHSVIDEFTPVIKNAGLNLAESMFDSQTHRIIEKAYYLPQVTSIYRVDVGISTKLGKTDYLTKQHVIKWQYYLDNYITTKKDKYYAISQIELGLYYDAPTLKKFVKFSYYFIRGQFFDCFRLRSILIQFYLLLRVAITRQL